MDTQRQIADLRRILEVTRRLAVTTNLDELLGLIVDAACTVLDCERATIFLYDPVKHELWSRVAIGTGEIRFPADRGIAGAAAQLRQVINVPDAYADSRFNREVDRQTGFRTRNLLTFPLDSLDGRLTGVLQALNKHGGPFTEEDEERARTLSAQAGVALDRWRLMEEYAAKQRLERDLRIAEQIQQAQFPDRNPTLPGFEVAGWNRSADQTGGDCYDFISLGDGRWAVLLADATGHGIPAALVIAQCRSLIRALLTVTSDLGLIASRVNDLLTQDLDEDHFVTCFLGVLDPARKTMEYVSGGQGPLLFVANGEVESRRATDMPLAVMSDEEYGQPERFEFSPGAMLVLLTDGFYESARETEDSIELFGEARVKAILQDSADMPLEDIIRRLHDAVREYASGVQADDLTAVLIRRTS